MDNKAREFAFEIYKNGDRENSDKVRIRLTDFTTNGFATNPDGLGMKNILGNLKIGNRNVTSKIENDIIPISLDVAFFNYEKYNNFLKEVAWGNSRGVLLYNIPGIGEFKRDIVFEEITKTEIKDGYLSASLTLMPESYWYKELVEVIDLKANELYNYIFKNDSELPCELWYITYYRCNELTCIINTSSTTKACKLQNLYELEYPFIKYSSEDGNSYILNQSTVNGMYKDILNSRYVSLDNNYVPFLKIPKLENAHISFKCDVDNTIRLKIRSFYISV